MNKNYIINNLVEALQRLPSIGQKNAKRLTINILQNKEEFIKPLVLALDEAYKKIKKCDVCGNFSTENLCDVCSDIKRDKKIICVVENVADLWAIENLNIYNGVYHILDGTLSAIEGRGIEVFKLDKLIYRIKNDNVGEVIIATNPTMDGQTTAFYIASHLEEFDLKVTQPALGVPMGSELNYLDDGTLGVAFKNKREF